LSKITGARIAGIPGMIFHVRRECGDAAVEGQYIYESRVVHAGRGQNAIGQLVIKVPAAIRNRTVGLFGVMRAEMY